MTDDPRESEEVTRVHPRDLEESDGGVATVATETKEPDEPEAIETQLVGVSTGVTDEDFGQPKIMRLGEQHLRTDSSRKATTLERMPRPSTKDPTLDPGTRPGVLISPQESDVAKPPDLKKEPKYTMDPEVRPVSLSGVSQDKTAPVIADPNVKPVARSEPTATIAPRPVTPDDRSNSILERIGTPADNEHQLVIKNVTREPVAPLREPSVHVTSQRLWIWAAVFGGVAVILVIIATMLASRS